MLRDSDGGLSAEAKSVLTIVGAILLFALVVVLVSSEKRHNQGVYNGHFGIEEKGSLGKYDVPVYYNIGDKPYFSNAGSFKQVEIIGYLVVPRVELINEETPFEVRYIFDKNVTGILGESALSSLYTSLPMGRTPRDQFRASEPVAEIELNATNDYVGGQEVFYRFFEDNTFRSAKIYNLAGYVYYSPTEQDILYRDYNRRTFFQSSVAEADSQ